MGERTTDNPRPAKILATEHGLVIADHPDNAAYFEHQRNQIGKRKLNKERKATVQDAIDDKPGNPNRVIGGRVKKESLTDDDAREIAIAKIDEKLLDLAEGDTDSPANTRARNDLRDMKGVIVGLHREPDLSFYGSAKNLAEQLEAGGDHDGALVASGAADLLRDARDGWSDDLDYSIAGEQQWAEYSLSVVQDVLTDHNMRVDRNRERTEAAHSVGTAFEELEAAKQHVANLNVRS